MPFHPTLPRPRPSRLGPRRALAVVAGAALVAVACGGDGAAGTGGRAAGTGGEPPPGTVAEAPGSDRPRTAARRGVRLARVGRFNAPVHVTAPPGDERRLFVVEQGGRIWVIRGGRRLARPFLDLSDRTRAGGEQGLLSLAFAPDYARSRRFYVDYTDRDGDSRIEEYRRSARNPNRAVRGSRRLVLFQPQPEANHNGGLLLFGPDRLLYVGFGDGGGGNDQHGRRGNAQSLGTLLGKILRIDPRPARGRPYRVPRDNPFVGRAGARPEIWSYGLRNPWRFSFDRRTGDLSIGDVGQDAVEEIDFVRRGRGRGANFGWRVWEGRRRLYSGETAPGHVPPVLQRLHSQGNCSITGGYVVRDRALAGLYGRYVFGDFCDGRILSVRLAPGRARDLRSTRLRVPALSSFGEDARGRVYATSLEGPVYRLAPR